MASTDPVKKSGRSKILACFKPVSDDEEPGCLSASLSYSEGEGGRKRKTRLRRSFSGTMKAVFSKAPLVKKLRSNKSRQELIRSNSNSNLSNENPRTKKKSSNKGSFSDRDNVIRTNSSTHNSSLFSSSSSRTTTCSSMSASSSRASSFSSNLESVTLDLKKNIKRRQSMKRVGGKFCAAASYSHFTRTGISMFIVCLLALACYGKVFAIFTCTSAWLFFAPTHRSHNVDPPEDVVDWAEQKKKVIMDGLLERNRSRLL